MERENRFAFTYVNGNGQQKTCYPRSIEQKDKNIAVCNERGYRIVKIEKLYPFSTIRSQHSFELISNVCSNRMSDMESGEIAFDSEEYDELADLRERAQKYFCKELPVAWVPYKEWADMKEIVNMAILHRQEACIANGRPDLVTLCVD